MSDPPNVTKLSEVDTRSSTYSVEDMLTAELERVKAGDRPGKQCLCIHLDTEDGVYHLSTAYAGFHKMTEVIAMLECLKAVIIKEDMNLT